MVVDRDAVGGIGERRARTDSWRGGSDDAWVDGGSLGGQDRSRDPAHADEKRAVEVAGRDEGVDVGGNDPAPAGDRCERA